MSNLTWVLACLGWHPRDNFAETLPLFRGSSRTVRVATATHDDQFR